MSNPKRITFFMAIVVGSLMALAACGDSESAAQPAAVVESAIQPTIASESIVAEAPVTESPGVPEVAVVPAEAVEPGSVEEKLLSSLERQIRAVNNQDWEGYLDVCSPAKNKSSAEKVRFMFEELGGEFGYDIPSLSMEGYNARNVVFTVYSAENARTEFDLYDHDTWLASGVS